jgi:hypothetical protein
VKRSFLIIIFLFVFQQFIYSQGSRKTILPVSAVSLQFAGSTGFLTGGYFRCTKNEIFQLGLLYGYVPKDLGGTLHSLSLKFVYNPFKIVPDRRIYIEPLQAGVFFCQNFGKNLYLTWPGYYPKDYYWWPASLRSHIFLSSSISARIDKSSWIDHLSVYFEVNTNDLYLASYLLKNNSSSVSFYDIIFFGTGLKLYLGKKTK